MIRIRRPLLLLFIALVTSSLVAASGLTITGVYYDPIQAESGGEAVQLENTGSTPVTLETASLLTKQSSTSLPPVTLLPGAGYLIADTGWSTLRDNISWPLADFETGLTLANTEGFVSIILNDTTLDTLAWNSTNKSREGHWFTHNGESSSFIPRNSNSTITEVPVTFAVQNSAPQIINSTFTDDVDTPGWQLLSYARVLSLIVNAEDLNGDNISVNASFAGNEITLNHSNSSNNTYSGSFTVSSLLPGSYTLYITASDGVLQDNKEETVSVLSTVGITVDGSLDLSGEPGAAVSGSFTVQNQGNVAKQVMVQGIPEVNCDSTSFYLEPEEERMITCTGAIPNTKAGNYYYTIKLLAS